MPEVIERLDVLRKAAGARRTADSGELLCGDHGAAGPMERLDTTKNNLSLAWNGFNTEVAPHGTNRNDAAQRSKWCKTGLINCMTAV
jgi:hypothetical protein